MTSTPRFDVVIPCYNYGHYVGGAVQSVLEQDVDVRVLVIDDCSQDNSAEICQELAASDPRVEFRAHEVNRGHIATYNEGIAWASGDYFLLLSADDLVLPGAFRRVADAFAAEPQMSMVHGRVLYFSDDIDGALIRAGRVTARRTDHPFPSIHAAAVGDGAGTPLHLLDAEEPEGFDILDISAFWRQNTPWNCVHAASPVVRTELQKQLPYKPELHHSGDLEMWLRLAARGPVGFIHRFQGAARVHMANMSRGCDPSVDLYQRVLAIDCIAKEDRALVPSDIIAQARRRFAKEALDTTTSGDAGQWHHERQQLVALAHVLDPGLRLRWAWARYLIKSALGPSVWHSLRSYRRKISVA